MKGSDDGYINPTMITELTGVAEAVALPFASNDGSSKESFSTVNRLDVALGHPAQSLKSVKKFQIRLSAACAIVVQVS